MPPVLFSVLTAAAAATVIAAGVSFTVMVVLAVKVFTHFQRAADKGFSHFTHIAFGTADDHDES